MSSVFRVVGYRNRMRITLLVVADDSCDAVTYAQRVVAEVESVVMVRRSTKLPVGLAVWEERGRLIEEVSHV